MIAKLLFESQRFLTLRNCTFTIFTPTYDRKKTISRTYDSILSLNLNLGGYRY